MNLAKLGLATFFAGVASTVLVTLTLPGTVTELTGRDERGTPREPSTYFSDTAGTVRIPAGYPGPGTAGLAGVGVDPGTLPEYEGPTTIRDETRLIEDQRITSAITVGQGGALTIRRSLVAHGHSHYGIETRDDGRLLLEDSTVRPSAETARAVRGAQVTIRRSDLRGGSTVANVGSGSVIENSFLADPSRHEGGHHDALQTNNAAGGVTVRGSTVIGHWQGQTSALFLQGNARWSGLHNVLVEGNFLSGGNYTMYLFAQDGQDPVTGAVVRDNLWNAGSWRYGPVSRSNVAEDLVWENNRTTDGEPVG